MDYLKKLLRKYSTSPQNHDLSTIEIPEDTFDPETMSTLTLSSQSDSLGGAAEKELEKLENFCPREFYKCKLI